MKNKGVKKSVSVRTNPRRIFLFYLVGLVISVGLLFHNERQNRRMDAAGNAAPPCEIQRRAERIVSALFPERTGIVFLWSVYRASESPKGVIWTADIRFGPEDAGRFIFDETGRLRICSWRVLQPASPIRRRGDALSLGRKYLRCLQKTNWYDCPLTEESQPGSPDQMAGIRYVRGRKAGARIFLILEARTGALVFFTETNGIKETGQSISEEGIK